MGSAQDTFERQLTQCASVGFPGSLELPCFGLLAASLAGQVRNSGERKPGNVLGDFFDLSLADFEIRVQTLDDGAR